MGRKPLSQHNLFHLCDSLKSPLNTRSFTPPPPPPPTHTHTRARARAYQGNGGTKEKGSRESSQGRFKRTDKGKSGADRNRELVPDNRNLVRERALTTELCSEGWYFGHSGVCRRVELPGRSVKVKTF